MRIQNTALREVFCNRFYCDSSKIKRNDHDTFNSKRAHLFKENRSIEIKEFFPPYPNFLHASMSEFTARKPHWMLEDIIMAKFACASAPKELPKFDLFPNDAFFIAA